MGQTISFFSDLFFPKKRMDVFLHGLDRAGKTTILYKLKLGVTVATTPTTRVNSETLDFQNAKLTFWDYGTQNRFTPFTAPYHRYIPCVVFVVDSSDKERIGLAREELQKTLEFSEFQNAALLVLANKQDVGTMSVTEITEKLGLHALRERNWYIQGTSAITGDGLYEGLDWLVQQNWE